jgi:hypothetical protein
MPDLIGRAAQIDYWIELLIKLEVKERHERTAATVK